MTAPLLTLVTNRSTAAISLLDLARRAVEGGVDRLQLREHDLAPRDLDRLASELVTAIGADRVALNDAPALAAELGTHLHLPERSVAGFVQRRGVRTVSCSVHSVDALAAVPSSFDHVLAGHVFATSSHPDSPPLGVDGLRRMVAATSLPVVAIGGIDPGKAADAIAAGAAGVAVISYVNSSPDPKGAARRLRDALEHAMTEHDTTTAGAITLRVNGKTMSLPSEATIETFLVERNLHPRLVVVERNAEIVAKSAYSSTVLVDGDILEIAHFVGGG